MAGNLNIPNPPSLGAQFSVLTSWLWRVMAVVNGVMKGKTNNFGGPFSLTINVASSTLTDPNIGGSSVILLSPTTAHAAAELPTLYFSAPGNQTVVINHANNAQADRTFSYVIVG